MPRKQFLQSVASVPVPSPGTPVPLSAVDLYVTSVIIQSSPGNLGFMYIGGPDASLVSFPLDPGRAVELFGDALDNGTTALLNLAEVFVDADQAGENVNVLYLGNS